MIDTVSRGTEVKGSGCAFLPLGLTDSGEDPAIRREYWDNGRSYF
ncbi:hypothetical protein D1BOALGB6SA_2291 [Olavius sp. associated proteobacterium Delta 1]|nr:hypothetical protein D1BOALGB6SA_2291 [Olavius sp. associated proteobacterium Delta 1]